MQQVRRTRSMPQATSASTCFRPREILEGLAETDVPLELLPICLGSPKDMDHVMIGGHKKATIKKPVRFLSMLFDYSKGFPMGPCYGPL